MNKIKTVTDGIMTFDLYTKEGIRKEVEETKTQEIGWVLVEGGMQAVTCWPKRKNESQSVIVLGKIIPSVFGEV
jgi:RNA polymerase-interacting CarD/CdnL/TRCF family regulator